MKNQLYSIEEVKKLIESGEKMLLAGPQDLLDLLPKGNWIGGTTNRFLLSPDAAVEINDKIFVTSMDGVAQNVSFHELSAKTITDIFKLEINNGFSILLLPFGAEVTNEFSINATKFGNFGVHPLCGWISGRSLDDGVIASTCYVYSGLTGKRYSDKALLMTVELPDTKYAEIKIFNPFIPDSGAEFEFLVDGVFVTDVIVNGVKRNFAHYLRETGYSGDATPLVTNYFGEYINVLIAAITEETVILCAPVFKKLKYKFSVIDSNLEEPELNTDDIVYALTCVGNYYNPEISSKLLSKMNGPVVYGEVAYQMLNYTTVYVTAKESSK